METFIRDVRQMNLEGRKLFIRVDFDVPLDKKTGAVLDDARIRAALPTIDLARKKGARIVLGAHLGAPDGRVDPKLSLLAVGSKLAELLDADILVPDASVGDGPRNLVGNLREGQIVLLENLRFHPEEDRNDDAFARQLALLCDAYVDDAFAAVHRATASVDALPRLVKERGAGLALLKDVDLLRPLLHEPKRPALAVVGGNKVGEKLAAMEGLIGRCDGILAGGAVGLALLAARGVNLGKTRIEADKLALARKVLARADARKVALVTPHDHLVVEAADGAAQGGREDFARLAGAPTRVAVNEGFPEAGVVVDLGPGTIEYFAAQIQAAKTVLWCGPMGVAELGAFAKGTRAVAEALAVCEGTTVAAGGDTVATLGRLGLQGKVTATTFGAGSALALLEGKELPGLEALRVPRPEL